MFPAHITANRVREIVAETLKNGGLELGGPQGPVGPADPATPAPPAVVELTRDALAEAQGFWTIVSVDEPTQTTYTTASGKVLPVVWEKPVQTLAPVIPQDPEWDHRAGTVHVPDLTGVEYRMNGQAIPPNVAFKVSETFPFTAIVEAVAKPGFFLPNVFTWEHRFPNATKWVLYASDEFSTDGKHERPMDMASGGSAEAAPVWFTQTGLAASTEPFFVAKDGVLTPEATGTGNTWLVSRLPFEDCKIEFEVKARGTGTFSLGFLNKISALNQFQGGLDLIFNDQGRVYFESASGNPEYARRTAKVRTEQEVLGRWTVEIVGQTVTITEPSGKQGSLTIDASVLERTPRNGIHIRNYKNTSGVQIDNLKIYSYES